MASARRWIGRLRWRGFTDAISSATYAGQTAETETHSFSNIFPKVSIGWRVDRSSDCDRGGVLSYDTDSIESWKIIPNLCIVGHSCRDLVPIWYRHVLDVQRQYLFIWIIRN